MAATYLQQIRRIPRDAWLSMVGFVLIYMYFMGVAGVLGNLYLLRMGYDARYVGLVNATEMIAYTVAGPLAGAAGRRWGCRALMMLGTGLATVGAVLFALGDLVMAGWRSVWLPTTYGLLGLGLGLYLVNGQVYIMAACGETGCDHAYAARSALGPVAAFVGSLLAGILPGRLAPVLGVTLAHPAAYRWPLLGAGLLQVVGLMALWPIRDATAPRRSGAHSGERASALPLIPIGVAALYFFLRWVGNGPPQTFMNVYMDSFLEASTETIGLVRSLGLILAVPAALVMPVLTGHWGRGNVLAWGAWVMGLASLALALLPIPLAAAIAFVVGPAFFALTNPIVPAFTQSLVAAEWRSVAVGVTTLVGGLAMSAMALGGGQIIASLGYRELFLIATAGSLAAGLLVWGYTRVAARRAAYER